MTPYKRLNATRVEIDGEIYEKTYTTDYDFQSDDPNSIFNKIKSADDAIIYNGRQTDSPSFILRTDKQMNAFRDLIEISHALNEGRERDDNGFKYYVYHDKGEFFICEHTYSTRNVIYFASRKLAQYSINIARKAWCDFYNVEQ